MKPASTAVAGRGVGRREVCSAIIVLTILISLGPLVGPGLAVPSTTPMTWPAECDSIVRPALMWPAPGDLTLEESLRWPASGDVTRVDLQVYFCRCDRLEPVTRSVRLADLCCAAAIDLLTMGPSAVEQHAGYESSWSTGPEVRSLGVEAKVAHLEVSPRVQGPLSEGSAEPPGLTRLALGQLIYTVTELPGVEAVEVAFEGRRLDAVEGMTLPVGPISRSDWAALTN